MKTIIITGATSGIGFECALQAARMAPNEQIIVACRDLSAGEKIIRYMAMETGHQYLHCLLLDLESLASIRAFKASLLKMENLEIIALINNAGIQIISETQITQDGFESTFGVNHLASFYLTVLLLPFMAKEASITFTASGVHDPLQKTGITEPVFKPAAELAYPAQTHEKSTVVGERRYSTSKLCNVLTVYELQRRLSGTGIRVNAFDPGMVPGTGLARTHSPVLRFLWKNILPLLTHFKHNVNTAQNSGRRLANLSLGEAYKTSKGKYFEGEKEIPSSVDSYNLEFQNTLFTGTLALLGIEQMENQLLELKNE